MFATLIFLWVVALIGFSIFGLFHEFIAVFRDAGIWIWNGHLVFGIVMAVLLWPWCWLVDRGNEAGESYRDAEGKVTGHQYDKDGPRRKTARIGAWVLFIFMGVYALVSIYPNEVIENRPDWIEDIKSVRDPINLLVVGADSAGVINQEAVRNLEQSQNEFFTANWRYMVLSLCFLGLIFVVEGMLSTKTKRGTGRIISALVFLTIIGLTWPGGMGLKELFLASWQWVVTSLCLIGLVISFRNMMGDKPRRWTGRIVSVLTLVIILLVTWSGHNPSHDITLTPVTGVAASDNSTISTLANMSSLESVLPYLVFALVILAGIGAFIIYNRFKDQQLTIDQFVKFWPYVYNSLFLLLLVFLFWPGNSSAISGSRKFAVFGMLLLGNIWFLYVARRSFENQKSNQQQKHPYSIFGCALMGLGLLILPLFSLQQIALSILCIVVTVQGIKRARPTVSWFKENFAWKSRKFWGAASGVLLGTILLITLLFKTGAISPILWMIYMVVSYALSGMQSIQAREICLPFCFGAAVNWHRSVIYRQTHRWEFTDEYRKMAEDDRVIFQSDPKYRDGYGTEGLFINWLSPALPWFNFVILPFEKKEQIYQTTFTQVLLDAGHPEQGSAGGIQDVIRIVGTTCFEPWTYWKLGKDERKIITKDELIHEETADKGNFGVALRLVKARRRRQLQSMDIDQALASKKLFATVNDSKETITELGLFHELQEEVRFDAGLYLETAELTDINVDEKVRQSLEDLNVSKKRRKKAEIDRETTEIEGRARGGAKAAEIEEVDKGLKNNKAGADYALQVTEAENVSVKSVIKKLKE